MSYTDEELKDAIDYLVNKGWKKDTESEKFLIDENNRSYYWREALYLQRKKDKEQKENLEKEWGLEFNKAFKKIKRKEGLYDTRQKE